MTHWSSQLDSLIAPAVAQSTATSEVRIGKRTLNDVGRIVSRVTQKRQVLVMADEAGFAAAGHGAVESLEQAGFTVETQILSCEPLPAASVEQAEPFRAALASNPDQFPVSVGSGVVNDLVKWAANETDRRYVTVATAASMDGYTSAGAPLARGGFKVTIPTRAPIAMIADLDVIRAAPAEMNAWGYGDLAGKMPAGGDWILADALDVEPIDAPVWALVQDHLRGWLTEPDGIAQGDEDAVARLFVGLTAVGFAMEFHGSSRPASGADHQIAHLWEMEGHSHAGRKVSHGAAVSVGCIVMLTLFDWLIQQDLTKLDPARILARAPSLDEKQQAVSNLIADPNVAKKAQEEVAAKFATPDVHEARLSRLKNGWSALRLRLQDHLLRADTMSTMLSRAGAPVLAAHIGVDAPHLLRTLRAAGSIRRRYTLFDLLDDTGLTDAALADVMPALAYGAQEAAE